MLLSATTSIHDLVTSHPYLIEVLADYAPAFAKLRNPLLRNTLGRVATLQQAADLAGLELTGLMAHLARAIMEHTKEAVTLVPRGAETPAHAVADGDSGCGGCTPRPAEGNTADRATRLATLRALLERLHQGTPLADLKEAFASAVGDISAAEVASLEKELVAGGVAETEIKRLCSLHVDIFREALAPQHVPDMPPGHPVHTYRAENAEATRIADEIISQIDRMRSVPGDTESPLDELAWSFSRRHVADLLADLAHVERHYTRKEMQLFPMLEENGIEAPPKVMWEVHDDIRSLLRKARETVEGPSPVAAATVARDAALAVKDMVDKEETVLFPMALESLTEAQWGRVRHGEDEIGYAWVTPEGEWTPQAADTPESLTMEGPATGTPDRVTLGTGTLAVETLDRMLRTLPLDLSLVDAEDRVAYYTDSTHRIFPRSAGVIGRNVRNCHPPKSVHMVEEILARFKTGERDEAAFWIELGGRFLHIRYFAVRSDEGRYLGCLEVAQDVTDIRALSGQRRLLDWN
ncbi:DUF438 domain-containing protein [Nitratidesulfovibrio vulgaris]|uniref:Hemerythrin HHE cation binding domain protein n=1 Tax=Nitratidesulfovibrio vulgaris (strain DP4) TaxID=391774 RepID=A0A0H3A5T0_NITV4|nr:DUF438 domain-containing protein [Nitratidesulfovibrio vulgaris]ABM27681.1 Hemerythrin HHE cation binding domain protein [Nitratidesulfovibrio vulgaris DP4]GEB81520.1 histidine kinase [Desulfovibrio desulfuricans]